MVNGSRLASASSDSEFQGCAAEVLSSQWGVLLLP